MSFGDPRASWPVAKVPGAPKVKKLQGPLRVFVCSPLRAGMGRTIEQNIVLAKKLCVAAIRAGVAPFAPHVLYTAIGLDDRSAKDRAIGMEAGQRWLAVADALWVYATDYESCSEGMKREIDLALHCRIPIDVVYMPSVFEAVAATEVGSAKVGAL